jgi:hypothetical protein
LGRAGADRLGFRKIQRRHPGGPGFSRALRGASGDRPVSGQSGRHLLLRSFYSDLFHETDRIAFKEGYLNRRINITMLYGRREAPAKENGDA